MGQRHGQGMAWVQRAGLTLAAWMAVALMACTPPPAGPGTELTGRLTFFKPGPLDTLTAADDADLQQAGIQVAVQVRGFFMADGTLVTLSTDGQTLSAPLANGAAAFTVTLTGGPFPLGRAHTLGAAAPGATPAELTVRVVDNTGPRCSLVAPVAGAVLHVEQDVDSAAAGLQFNLVLSCTGDGVLASQPVTLEVFTGGAAAGEPWTRLTGTLQADFNAAFAGLTLPDGLVTLQFGVDAGGPALLGLARASVTVDLNRCDARLVSPDGRVLITSSNTVDLDPSTPELDTRITVNSFLCPAGAATVTVAGSSAFTQPLTGGVGHVPARLLQGNNTLAVEVADAVFHRSNGQDGPVTVTVDTLAPCPALSVPAAGHIFTVMEDEEQPPNPANGLTFTVHGTLDHPEGASQVTLELSRLPSHVLVSLLNVDVSAGAFSQTYADLAGGDYVLSMSSEDDHGNRCPARTAGRREVRFSVDVTGPRASLALADDANVDLVLTAAEDLDPTLGLQARVLVTVLGTPAEGASARLRFTPLDDLGQPTTAPAVETEANLLGTATVLSATVPDGRYRLSCVVSFPDARPNLTAMTLTVLVDASAPDLLILAPVDGATITQPSVDVQVLSNAADLMSLSLLVDLVPQTVPAVPQGSGVFLFSGVTMPTRSGPHALQVSARDTHGNRASVVATVQVHINPPAVTLRGVDRDGSDRTLEPPGTVLPQARTLLDISTPVGAMALDLDGDASNGLQYGFSVEVPLQDCLALGQHPLATLTVDGLAEALSVPLVVSGSVCRGVARGGGPGITLPEGDGSAGVTISDVAGNVGAARVFYTVRRQPHFVRIDLPLDGQRLGSAPVVVTASTNNPAAGLCTLHVNMATVQTLTGSGTLLMFDPILLPGLDGTSVSLDVACVNGGTTLLSQTVTVVKDLVAPSPTVALLNTDPVPASFNALSPSDGPVAHPRFLRDFSVLADAERGGCSHLGAALLTAQGNQDPARDYPPHTTAAGAWTLVPDLAQGRCVAAFLQVDLGALEEPGRTTQLTALVTDSAGNVGHVQPVTVLTDRVAPALARVRPVSNRVRPSEDALADVTGVQTVVEVAVAPDGRPAAAVMTCSGSDSASCPAASRPVVMDRAVFGLDAADAVTLGTGLVTATADLTVQVTDAAGNVATLALPLRVADGAAVTWVAPVDGARFNILGGNNRVADLDPAVAGLQARLTLDVLDCAVGAMPGNLEITANGAPLTSSPVNADGPLELAVTLPQGDAVLLSALCTPALGLPTGGDVTVRVDSVAPGDVTLSTEVTNLRRGQLAVRFVAPGDDDGAGLLPPGAYQLAVRADAPPTEADFASGGVAGAPPIPQAPGMMETASLSGLLLAGSFYVGLRVQDDELNSRVFTTGPLNLSLRSHPVSFSGLTVTSVSRQRGDINGDGVEDVVVTAQVSGGGGRVLVFFGDSALTGGYAQSALLTSVPRDAEVLPDLDGDGRAEVFAADGSSGARALIWFGRAGTGLDLGAADLSVEDGAHLGEPVDLGQRVAVTDLNGDGKPDLVVTAPCAAGTVLPTVFVALGDGTRAGLQTAAGTLDLDARWQGLAGIRLQGALGSTLGASLSGAGDLDGNGASDVVLGAPQAGVQNAGTLFVVYGRAGLGSGATHSFTVETVAASELTVVALPGAGANARLGEHTVVADVDGSGRLDLVATSSTGVVVFRDDGNAGFSTVPVAWGPVRTWLAPSGDVNGDPVADLLADGEAWLGAAPLPTVPAVYAAVAGPAVAADLNGDGFPDLVNISGGGLVISY